jgi:hypothetical protein
VRTPIGAVDVNDKLAQGVRYRDSEMIELKIPDRISALKLARRRTRRQIDADQCWARYGE